MEHTNGKTSKRNKNFIRNLAASFHHETGNSQVLPPIGVFWDIENCQVPKGKSSVALVCEIRNKFFVGHREAEFMCVCDVNKENQDVIRELNLAQVTVVHINATSKNAADDKLRQCMRRFVEMHRSPSTIVLISGDINFATDLSDFRHRLKIHVILIHNRHTPDSLLACAHETVLFSDLTVNLPNRNTSKNTNECCELLVTNLPTNKDSKQVQQRLKQLSDNCGGKVIFILASTAILKFPSSDAAQRASKRMDKEDVYGHKISVSFTNRNSENCGSSTTNGSSFHQSSTSSANDQAIEKILNMMAQSGMKQQSSSTGTTAIASKGFHDEPSYTVPFEDNSIVAACPSPIGANRAKMFNIPTLNPPEIYGTSDSVQSTKSLWNSSDSLFLHDQDSLAVQHYNSLGYSNFQPIQNQRNSDYSHFPKPLSPKQYSSSTKTSTDIGQLQQSYQRHTFNSSQQQTQSYYYNQDNTNIKLSQQQQKSIGRVSPFMMANQSCHGCSSNGVSSHYRSTSPYSRSNTSMYPDQGLAPVEINGAGSVGTGRSSRYSPNMSLRDRTGNLSPGSDSHLSSRPHHDTHYPYRSRSASPLSNIRGSGQTTDSGYQQQGVELLVTNLDQSLDINEMKKILASEFGEHVMVLHITMLLQPDGTHKAVVKLANMADAQLAISHLQRKRIGFKRILISYTSGGKAPPLYVLKAEVAALLTDVPTKRMPLFKFRELFFNRYHRSIGISELYKLNDTIQILEDGSGRMVSLIPNYRSTPSPVEMDQIQSHPLAEKPFCERHMTLAVYRQLNDDAQTSSLLPDVCISLKVLAPRVHTLLDIHQGNLPLNSFGACYKSEFGDLPVPKLKAGTKNEVECCPCVPLEHLISCIPGVEITKSVLGIKRVQWLENRVDPSNRSVSPALVGKLMLFSREMSDLLKSQTPRCCIPFSKLIPAYHHHFGRQCRVADYGYTKLIDLMEALPHVVQILGEGHNRMLTLTHSTQLKRFASDMIRILKSRPSKQICLSEFADAFTQCMDKPFDIAHYGVCDINDMLSELLDTIVISHTDNDTIIAIPKREQTPEELERTKQFAVDVFELLRHTPSCSLPFNKFIPSYHHHFGRQCRVSSYGFTKLIELFEAIPDVLEVIGHGEEKVLRLTMKERLKVFTERAIAILNCKLFPSEKLLVKNFLNQYAKHHGHCLKLKDYDCDTIEELLEKISHAVQIEDRKGGKVVVLVDQGSTDLMGMRIRRLLMTESKGELTLEELASLYEKKFMSDLDMNAAMSYINKELLYKDRKVKLTPLLRMCRDVIQILRLSSGGMQLPNLERSFLEHYGYPLQTAKFGFSSLAAFLTNFPEYFTVKGRRGKKTVFLANENFEEGALDSPFNPDDEDGENCYAELEREILEARSEQSSEVEFNLTDDETSNFMKKSPLTILNQPIPSCIPSPAISPESEPVKESNLMGFETPFSMNYLDSGDSDLSSIQPTLFSSNNFFYPNSSSNTTSTTSNDLTSMDGADFNQFMLKSSQPTDYERLKQAFDPMPPTSWLSVSNSTLNVNAEVFSSRSSSLEHLERFGNDADVILSGTVSNQDDDLALGLSAMSLACGNDHEGFQVSPSKAVGNARPSRKIAAQFAKSMSKLT